MTLAGEAADLVVGLADEASPAGPVALLDTAAVLALGRRLGRAR